MFAVIHCSGVRTGYILTSGVAPTKKGTRVASAGLDFGVLAQRNREKSGEYISKVTHFLGSLNVQRKPMIGAINGVAVAGGCILFLNCEYRVVNRFSQLGMTEAVRGINIGFGYAAVQRVVGTKMAEYVCQTSKIFKGTHSGVSVSRICMHARMHRHTCIHAHAHTHTHACSHTACTHTHICMHTHTHMHAHTLHARTHTCMHSRAHTHMHTHTACTHTHMHTHTHACTHMFVLSHREASCGDWIG